VWRRGGHAGGISDGELTGDWTRWFDPPLRGTGRADASFEVTVPGGGISAQTGRAVDASLRAPTAFDQRATVPIAVSGAPQSVYAPAGASPAAVSSLPGLGGVLSSLSTLGGLGQLGAPPGQVASFRSDPLPRRVLIAGSSSIALDVTAGEAGDATLFASVQDIAPNGTATLPNGLVAPIRLTGLAPGSTTRIEVALPSIVWQAPAGDRLAVVVSTTDMAYQLPADPRGYRIALADADAGAAAGATLQVATVDAAVREAAKPWIWLIAGLAALGAAIGYGAIASARRARRRRVVAELADVPIAVSGLVKDYGSYRAVDGVDFRVERGQVVGLLGPNGAGKTTVLRVLMGLIRPTSGSVRIFGEQVDVGAPVLSRIGAFVEGPGLLPHLSGRDNLRLYWAATGRPARDAHLDTALEIAGLGTSIERRVKTYSQGMRQRLAIAQAMLGLPELLVLAEPTNGLDPPQIAEMREVLGRYAQTGRTVIVSSHLLAEVEQTCTHVVVMHKGRLVAAGSVASLAGSGAAHLEVDDPARAAEVLAAAGIEARAVPGRRALEEVFLEMVGAEQ
jgi:ABC-2 type transport system ATP-binding protein